MSGEWILYIVFGATALVSAIGVVFLANPIHSALSLIGALASVAGLFLAQEAFFLSVVQIIVYTGAVVVLFLFVIMLLGIDSADPREEQLLRRQWFPWAFLGGVIGVGGLVLTITGIDLPFGVSGTDTADAVNEAGGNVQALSERLFTDWLLPFELTSILVVAAIVGGVVLAKRTKDLRGSGMGLTPDLAERISEEVEADAAEGELDPEDAFEADDVDPDPDSDAVLVGETSENGEG
ncbi:MAG: NADH-quinone oxidoreductase subunit J [Acidimicrobiia bacterium]|nr:NADH-quinone oxidoreductase subunit J [Acidimicrobiia bacterium]